HRRATVREAIRRGDVKPSAAAPEPAVDDAVTAKGLESLDEVEALLRRLSGKEREGVRLFYLEGRTYEESSTGVGMPVNSTGGRREVGVERGGAGVRGGGKTRGETHRARREARRSGPPSGKIRKPT